VLKAEFRDDLAWWIRTEPRIATRTMKLLEEVLRDPVAGIGKPEPLKHRERGMWSRRITSEHRFVYRISSAGPLFVRARHHD